MFNLTSTGLVVSGSIAGALTLNQVVLGTISGTSILVKTGFQIKSYKKLIEMAKFAYTTYQKMLVNLRSYLRGIHFDHEELINEMKVTDDIIIDLCPPIDKIEKILRQSIYLLIR